MSGDFRDDLPNEDDDTSLMLAAHLVAHAKRLRLGKMELPAPDKDSIWMVSVKELKIAEDDPFLEPPMMLDGKFLP